MPDAETERPSTILLALFRVGVGAAFLIGAVERGAPDWLLFAVVGSLFAWRGIRDA